MKDSMNVRKPRTIARLRESSDGKSQMLVRRFTLQYIYTVVKLCDLKQYIIYKANNKNGINSGTSVLRVEYMTTYLCELTLTIQKHKEIESAPTMMSRSTIPRIEITPLPH